MSRHSQTGAFGTGDWLMGAVKRNPEGLLLLAAGAALLLRGVGSSQGTHSGRHWSEQRSPRAGSQYESHWNEAASREATSSGTMSPTGERARGYASDMADQVVETASGYASTASDYAGQARRAASDYAGQARRTVSDYADQVSEQSGRAARRARSTVLDTFNRVLQDQPLAVAVAGLAAGAALAAAFPVTDVERRTLGPAGERLADAADQVRESLKEGTSKASQTFMSAAEERGLSADGLKEMAGEAAGAFGSAFSGEQSGTEQSSTATHGDREAGKSTTKRGP
jgi:hypothetical protein